MFPDAAERMCRALFAEGQRWASSRGLILVDTKYEIARRNPDRDEASRSAARDSPENGFGTVGRVVAHARQSLRNLRAQLLVLADAARRKFARHHLLQHDLQLVHATVLAESPASCSAIRTVPRASARFICERCSSCSLTNENAVESAMRRGSAQSGIRLRNFQRSARIAVQ